MKNEPILGLSNHPSCGCNFLSEDNAIISEHFIAIAGDNLPMHNINILIPDHQPPTGP